MKRLVSESIETHKKLLAQYESQCIETVVEAVETRVAVAARSPPAPAPTVNIYIVDVDAADANPSRGSGISSSKGPVAGM